MPPANQPQTAATADLQRDYQVLFERVPCYVAVLDRGLRIVRANEKFRATFGDCAGTPCYLAYKRHDAPCRECPAQETFRDGQGHSGVQTGVDQQGQPVHYIITTSPLGPDYVMEMAVDVTQTRELSRELEHTKAFQENLIHNSIDAIVAADANGLVTVFSRAAGELFHCLPEQAMGRGAEPFFPREFLQVIAEAGRTCVLPETTLTARDGARIPVRFSGAVLHREGQVVGGAGFFQDLRPIKQLQQEILETERLAAVGGAAAGIAHGVKNILEGLEASMYVVKSGVRRGDERVMEQGWQTLERNIEKVSSLVREFLTYAKAAPTAKSLVDPNAIVEDVAALYQDSARQATVELVLELGAVEPAWLDREGIHTSLANLASNALDACVAGEKPNGRVVFRTADRDGKLVLEVEDTGCGMDSETQERIFTAFFSTKGADGTGLGLSITSKIVSQHHGAVEVESTVGQGTVTRIELPRDKLTPPE